MKLNILFLVATLGAVFIIALHMAKREKTSPERSAQRAFIIDCIESGKRSADCYDLYFLKKQQGIKL